MSKLARISLLSAAIAATLAIPAAQARQGADDPAGHVRQCRGCDDASRTTADTRRGRGADDSTADSRRGRGADDPAGDDRGRGGHGADDGPNHT